MMLVKVNMFVVVFLKKQNKKKPNKQKLEAQGPCTGHRSIIAILYCFSFEYMKSTQIYVD